MREEAKTEGGPEISCWRMQDLRHSVLLVGRHMVPNFVSRRNDAGRIEDLRGGIGGTERTEEPLGVDSKERTPRVQEDTAGNAGKREWRMDLEYLMKEAMAVCPYRVE